MTRHRSYGLHLKRFMAPISQFILMEKQPDTVGGRISYPKISLCLVIKLRSTSMRIFMMPETLWRSFITICLKYTKLSSILTPKWSNFLYMDNTLEGYGLPIMKTTSRMDQRWYKKGYTTLRIISSLPLMSTSAQMKLNIGLIR